MANDPGAVRRRTEADQFERWLEIIPLCRREGGRVSLARLARTFGDDESVILADVEALVDRDYYLTSRFSDSLVILIESERVSIDYPGYFERPLRLAPKEALALQLGLQIVMTETPSGERSAVEDASRELTRALESVEVQTGDPHHRSPGAGDAGASGKAGGETGDDRDVLAYGAPLPDASVRAFDELRLALRERRAVELRYFKPHDPDEAPVRHVEPWALAEAHGVWYLLAREVGGSTGAEEGPDAEAKLFRLDRVLDARVTDLDFEPPRDLRVEEHIDPERIYRGDEDDLEVVIRYGPRIARWIEERYGDDAIGREDGSVEVRHRCKSPSWALARAFRYGGEAAIVEPAAVRNLARRALESLGEAAA